MENSNSNQKGCRRNLKLIVVGDLGVGKTSLIMKIADEKVKRYSLSTMGVDFCRRTLCIGENIYQLNILDTPGNPKIRDYVFPTFMKKSNGVVLVYDVNSVNSIQSVEKWVNSIINNGGSQKEILILGNKIDLVESVFLKEKEICTHRFVSATTGENVIQSLSEFCQTLSYKEVDSSSVCKKPKRVKRKRCNIF